jgi:hypothetical protein
LGKLGKFYQSAKLLRKESLAIGSMPRRISFTCTDLTTSIEPGIRNGPAT